ncbi:L-glutamate gamma-semialdehyde dehydrogenase [Candidatus Poribacteria bacterium]|nr:L-glutamate gamma-semialdehyde dehydrogenase [Candidatus Poribacteria bacterium]
MMSSLFVNEPATDFSSAANCEKMKMALEAVRRRLGKRYPLVIGGEKIETDSVLSSVNPSKPGEVVGYVAMANTEHVSQAIEAAGKAFPAWRDTDFHQRVEFLFRAAEKMRQRRFELAALIILEIGKNWREADADVTEAIDFLEYYGREMLRLGEPIGLGNIPDEKNEYSYQPRGVGVVISPWNFPLAIPTGMASAAIATGNAVILKPASQSPVIASWLVDILLDAGIPGGVINYLPGSGEQVGEFLVKSPLIQFIAFTGSKKVGLKINRLAGDTFEGQEAVKKVVMEMGGKNAIIIDSDANLDAATSGVIQSAFGYQGQKCSACSRVIVLEDIYDIFLEKLVASAKTIRIGSPEELDNFMGPLISEEALRKVERYVEIGKSEGRLVLGGERIKTPPLFSPVPPLHPHAPSLTLPACGEGRGGGTEGGRKGGGYFFSPTIFVDVPPKTRIAQEEIFGPVLSVIKVNDLSEAIAVANGTQYALTGGIYSRNRANIERAKREFRVGNLYVNRKITGAIVSRQPFGGFKMSGVGSKAGGPDYLVQFMVPRTVTENTIYDE